MKTIRIASAALMAMVGLVVATGCSAPADGANPEEAASSSAALSQGTISATASGAQVTVTGSGFTAGGEVQIWAYDEEEGKWTAVTTVTATTCPSSRLCLKGSVGKISAVFDLRCNSVQRILALDKTTEVYSTEPTVSIQCIG